MKLTEVAIVAVDGFSPFHYSVPCMLFGDTVSETKRFNLHICAERPGLLSARDGFALNASGDFSLLAQADIVVVPYWGAVNQRHRSRYLTAWFARAITVRRSSACASGRLYSATPGCWTTGARRPTGSSGRIFAPVSTGAAGYQRAVR